MSDTITPTSGLADLIDHFRSAVACNPTVVTVTAENMARLLDEIERLRAMT